MAERSDRARSAPRSPPRTKCARARIRHKLPRLQDHYPFSHLHAPNFPAAVPVRAPGPKSLRTLAGLGGSSQHPHKEKQKESAPKTPSHRGSHRGSPKDHKGKKTRPQKKNLGPVAAVMEGGFEVLEEGCPSREGKGKGESRLFVRS